MRVSRCDEGRVAVILHRKMDVCHRTNVSLSDFEDKRFHHLLKKTLPFKLLISTPHSSHEIPNAGGYAGGYGFAATA